MFRRHAELPGSVDGHGLGIPQAVLAGAGVGLAAVDDDAARAADGGDARGIEPDGGGLDLVGGEGAGQRGGLIGEEHGHVRLAGSLESGNDAGGAEAGGERGFGGEFQGCLFHNGREYRILYSGVKKQFSGILKPTKNPGTPKRPGCGQAGTT